MKRTLFEILGGLAVVVTLVSFHHQLQRLKTQGEQVESLRRVVTQTVANAGSKEDLQALRRQIQARLDGELERLQGQIAEASASGKETARLRKQLESTRVQADRFKSEIERDVVHTRELVDAFHAEVRAVERKTESGLEEARSHLAALQGRVLPDRHLLTKTMLAPSVQLNGEDTVGSGTLVYSGFDPSQRAVSTYVLTAFHVVRNILADTPSAKREGIPVVIYTSKGKIQLPADLVVRNERIDTALVRLRTHDRFDYVASVASKSEAKNVAVWDEVYAVGCPLGNDPIPTQGEISSTTNVLNDSNYWMINAPTYFGNSGGGVYLGKNHKLVGVFSKIYTHGRGSPIVVPHMGLCTPMTLIRDWLVREKMDYILDGAPDAQLAATPGK